MMQAPYRPSIRLYIPKPYHEGGMLETHGGQHHYLAHVMRCRVGDAVAVFNGSQGEWLAEIAEIAKRGTRLALTRQAQPQRAGPDVWLAFAPLKHKTELVVEKAVELGVSRVLPVVTQHTVARHVNTQKFEAHAVEAAEQCGRHDVPQISAQPYLARMLADWPAARLLLYGDESGESPAMEETLAACGGAELAVLIGPEGGFSAQERRMLGALPFARGFCMGPRILRADTAAVAALACLMARRGDWDRKPRFAG